MTQQPTPEQLAHKFVKVRSCFCKPYRGYVCEPCRALRNNEHLKDQP